MALVGPSLDLHNIFMVLLIFTLGNIKIGATKAIFFYSGSPRVKGGGFMRAWAWFVFIV